MRTEATILPELFLDRLRFIYPEKRYHELVNTFTIRKPVSFRINSLKTDPHSVKEYFSRFRIKLFQPSWSRDVFQTNAPLTKIEKSALYQEGVIYVQRLPSMIPPLVLKPKETDIVLDMAAAPGSKTTQMAALMNNKGLIIAIDKDLIRAEKLLYNIAKQGVGNTRVRQTDATKIWKEYPAYFDKILLDAPCSSEARFYINSPLTFKHWSEDFIKKMSHLQKKLIASALVCLKVGGVLVYSTCTYAPEENEEVIDWAVNMGGDRIDLENIQLKLSNTGPVVLKWRGKTYAKKISRCVRILPTKDMEGFFICKIRKTKEIKV